VIAAMASETNSWSQCRRCRVHSALCFLLPPGLRWREDRNEALFHESSRRFRPDPRYVSAVSADFSTGRIAFNPKATLLDWLASSLLDCRHKLGFCSRKRCATPYFVKTHPRARYCSEACFRESRLESKSRWWKRNRSKRAPPLNGKKSAKEA
jgi:hypothetical protein